MPDVNEFGEVAHGIAGVGCNYQNKLFSPGGSAWWKNNDEIAFCNANDGWLVSIYNVRTKQIRRFDFGQNEFHTANTLFAGGDHVAIWGPLISTTGLRLPEGGLLGMSKDGAVCYKPSYQSNGPTHIRELDGRDYKITDGHAYSLQMLGNGKAVWADTISQRWEFLNIPRPTALPPDALFVHIAETPKGAFISHFSSKGVCVTPVNSFVGIQIVPAGQDAWHNLTTLNGGMILQVTWSIGIGEATGQIRVRQIDITTNMIRDPWGDNLWKPAELIDIRTIKNYDVPPVLRKMWAGFFVGGPQAGGGWTTNDDPRSLPGNCYLAVQESMVKDKNGTNIRKFISGPTVEEIERQLVESPYSVVYWDARRWPRLPNVPVPTWIGIQAYCKVNESIENFEQDMRAAIQIVPSSRPVALIAQCYTSNETNTKDLQALVPVYARLTNEFKNIVAILVFSGSGRATGLQDHPEVRASWDQFMSKIQTPPKDNNMQPPRITITEYSPKSGVAPLRVRAVYAKENDSGPIDKLQWLIRKVGIKDWTLAALNPGDDPDHTYVIKEAGTWEIKLKALGPGGEWETGAQRIIQVSSATPQPEPEPEPQPNPDPQPQPEVEGKWTSFKTSGNFYLSADRGLKNTQLIANRTSEGEYEKFFAITVAPSTVVLRSTNNKYVQVTGESVFANAERDKATAFEVVSMDGGKVALKANGKFVTAELGGGGRIVINRTNAALWESFESSLGAAAVQPVGELSIDGKFFRVDGQPVTIIETSEFSLFKRFLDGEDIRPVVAQRRELGFNMLRVWLLNKSTVVNGGIHPKDYPNYYEKLSEFCDQLGMFVELTVFTSTHTTKDDVGLMPDAADQQQHLNRVANAVRGKKNVLLELVNESDQYNNAPSESLQRPEGVIISRGSNGADGVPPRHDAPWDYEQYHTNDLDQWWRKTGHNAMEWADQSRKPCMAGENTRPDRDGNVNHFYDAAMGAALLCAGSCFHSQPGKTSELFSGHDLACAQAWVEGARSVPVEFQIGSYQHRQDLEGPDVIRGYSRRLPDGREHVIRIRA